jgi:iron(III) transport system ATP-binding protein
LDEPFSNLDAALRAQVRTEIHQLLVGLGITTVFVTHDQDEAFVLGDRVAVLAGGRVVQIGPPSELYQRPATRWLAGFVGEANLLSATAEGDQADTALGRIPLHTPATGPIDVLVRPEDLALVPGPADGSAGGVDAVVELVEFVGHDTTYLVRSGELSLQVRRPSMPVATRGDRVSVSYSGDAAAWFLPE